MKHKILRKLSAAVLVLAMICTQLSIGAFAEGGTTSAFLVKYGSTTVSCDTTDAVNTALSDANTTEPIEIEMQSDVTNTSAWVISKSCTLDLNGKTYTGGSGTLLGKAIQISDGATVTITGDGTIVNEDMVGSAVMVGSSTDTQSSLILSSGTLSATTSTGIPTSIWNYGSTTINGGKLTARLYGNSGNITMTSGEIANASGNAASILVDCSFTMSGGKITAATANNGNALDISSTKATITGGTIEQTNAGVAISAGNVEISGSTQVISAGKAAISVGGGDTDSVVIEDDAKITASSGNVITGSTRPKVTIKGGTFKCGASALPFSPNSSFVTFPEGKTLSATQGTDGYTVVDKTKETDTSTLEGLLDGCEAIYATGNANGEDTIYKSSTWTPFALAYETAQTIAALDAPLQAEADIAASNLKSAKDGLIAMNSNGEGTKFGADGYKLTPGLYKVPVYLRKSGNLQTDSAAAACIEKYAMLTVSDNGTAKLTVPLEYVEKLGVLDWAHDWMYKDASGTFVDITEYTTIETPSGTALYQDTVVDSITFDIPNNREDYITVKMLVDAMGYDETTGETTGGATAWLLVDYENAVEATSTTAETHTGSAAVEQFGKYTVNAKVTTELGMITGVEITGSDWGGSEDGIATNKAKLEKAIACTKTKLTSMSATDADAISKVDTVSGATTSCTAVKDAVINALGLTKTEEVINVPENELEAGTYTVNIAYITDQVAHGLTGVTKDEQTQATLTVAKDGSVTLATDIVNGTDKENLYVYNINGYYADNDRTGTLVTDGMTVTESDTAENVDTYFNDNVVTHVSMPLVGNDEGKAYAKEYWSNVSLYVPAMSNLDGEVSGVTFDHGKFSIDAYIKVYWDTLVQTSKDNSLDDGTYQINASVVKEDKESTSMANSALVNPLTLTVKDGEYTLDVDWQGIEVMGTKGYMGSISYYPGTDMTGTPTTATVTAYQTNDDGSYVVDQYNDANSPYPKTVQIPMVDGANMTYIPIQVNVPAMGSGSTGNANAYIKLDWDSVTAVDDTDTDDTTDTDDKTDTDDNNTNTDDNNNNTDDDDTINPIFIDVQNPSSYYYTPVYWAVDKGITVGTSATTFSPNLGCTRAQVATFLWRAAGSPTATRTSVPFEDVDKNAYYYDAILWAYENGIIKGMTDTTFEPDTTVTRAQFITMLWRYEGEPKASIKTSPFTDVAKETESNYWYYDAVLWASGEGIAEGMTLTTFLPNSTCTRAQVVTFLYRAANVQS